MSDLLIHVDGREEKTPVDTTFLELARRDKNYYDDEILLAKFDNRIMELNKKIPGEGRISLLTGLDHDGQRTYRRSLVFLMEKACFNILYGKNADLFVRHSLGQGYFCELESEDQEVNEDFLKKLKAEMLRLIEMDLPIKKYSIKTREAIKIFHDEGLYNKEKLLRYRTSSNINVYELDGYVDYYYGCMVPSTSYLKVFDLRKYDSGFILQFPYKDLKKPYPFTSYHKLFEAEKSANEWSELLRIPTVGALNDVISSGNSTEMVLMQEALMEQKIGDLAEDIKKKKAKFVLIAGPSSSGKTTFSYRLSIQLRAKGLNPHPLSLDDYYIDRDKILPGKDGKIDLESIDALDIDGFNHDMNELFNGKEIDLPTFNFKTGKREYRGRKMKLMYNDLLVIEGIHGLNERLSSMLPKESKYKIYISDLTQLSIDEHNPLSTTDGRLIRRIVRDARTRGTSARDTIAMWDSVRRGEEKNIFPFQESADSMFNSALIYEMPVLKLYAEPLLMGISEDCPEYCEARRLVKLLDYFLPLPPDAVNNTSLLREFIGGSILNV